MRRHPVQIQPYKTSVDTAGDHALMLRLETADATINATLSIRMMQQLHEQIGQLIEPRKITRAWADQLNPNLDPNLGAEDARESVVVVEDLGSGGSSKA